MNVDSFTVDENGVESLDGFVEEIVSGVDSYSSATSINDVQYHQCVHHVSDTLPVEGYDMRLYGEYIEVEPVVRVIEDSDLFECVTMGFMNDPNGDSYLNVFVKTIMDNSIDTSVSEELTEMNQSLDNTDELLDLVFEAVRKNEPVSVDELFDLDLLSDLSVGEVNWSVLSLSEDDRVYFDDEYKLCVSMEGLMDAYEYGSGFQSYS